MRTIRVYPYGPPRRWFVDFVYLASHREAGGVNDLVRYRRISGTARGCKMPIRTSLNHETMSSGVSFAGSNAAAELYAGDGSEGRDGCKGVGRIIMGGEGVGRFVVGDGAGRPVVGDGTPIATVFTGDASLRGDFKFA